MDVLSAISPKPINGPVGVSVSGISVSESKDQKYPDKRNILTNEEIHQSAKEVKESTNAKINRIAEAMDSYVRSVRRDIKIQVHSETGNIMVKVISEDNGKVVREIPPKELLDLAAKMEEMTGALFNENV